MYPISVVAQKTGLTAEVLRAWERRYEGIAPDRDGSGRRIYSRALLDRLTLVSRLLQAGYRVGDVVSLSAEQLTMLIEELGPPQDTAAVAGTARSIGEPSRSELPRDADVMAAGIEAVRRLDGRGLRIVADDALTVHGRLGLADRFVFPLMRKIKDLVRDGELRDLHVSFARSNLQVFVSAFLVSAGPGEGPGMAIATPPGYASALGALAAAVHVQAAGWRPILLGAEVAPDDIARLANAGDVQGVILTCVSESYDLAIYQSLVRVRESVPVKCPVYFGGRMPETLVRDLRDAGLVSLNNMEHLRTSLSGILEQTARQELHN